MVGSGRREAPSAVEVGFVLPSQLQILQTSRIAQGVIGAMLSTVVRLG